LLDSWQRRFPAVIELRRQITNAARLRLHESKGTKNLNFMVTHNVAKSSEDSLALGEKPCVRTFSNPEPVIVLSGEIGSRNDANCKGDSPEDWDARASPLPHVYHCENPTPAADSRCIIWIFIVLANAYRCDRRSPLKNYFILSGCDLSIAVQRM